MQDDKPDLHLVLLPGLDGTGWLFEPLLNQFSDEIRVTVISYPMDKVIPFERLDEYILPRLPIGQPLVILGESYSGPVAIRLASRGDINIRKIILVATFSRYPDSFLKSISQILPLSFLLKLPIPDFLIRYYCFGEETNKSLYENLRKSIKENNPVVLASRLRSGTTIDVTALLLNIKIPCLYISASNDRLVPKKALDTIQKNMPDFELITIKGSHFILQVQPERCFDVIDDFINKCD